MEYFLIIASALIVTALIVGVVICLWKKANSRGEDVISDEIPTSIASEILATEQVQKSGITIPIEQLPATTQIDEKSLFEITDGTALARISQAIPMAAETAARTAANKANIALKNVELYKMDIPYKDLMKSKEIEGAVRASTRNAKNITKNANLIKVDTDKISKTTAVANGAANVMNIASLVVGQYYMSEISSKLETMTKSIDKISDFQDREFKSRILSVITLVGEISQFSSEIMENDDQRTLKLSALENLKATATELLGQVNIEQSVQTRTLLGQWHDQQIKALRIDLDKERISKTGFEAVVSAIPGLIDNKFNYKELKKNLVHEISAQTSHIPGSSDASKQIYEEDVEIIIKDGKYYYLHQSPDVEF